MNRGQAFDLIMDSALPGPAKLILLGYLKHQDSAAPPDEALSWPGAKRLAAYADISEANAIERRGVLFAAGVLVIAEVAHGGSLRCRIDFTRLPSAEEVEAMEEARLSRRVRPAPSARRTPLVPDDPSPPPPGVPPSSRTTPPLVPDDPSPSSGTTQSLFIHPSPMNPPHFSGQQPPAAPPPGPPSSAEEVESDPEPPVLSKEETPPKRDAPKEVWEQLQAIRKEQEPKARGQELTTARRTNLRSRMAELLKAKLTREDLLLAARWVYTSANMRAEGARKTGDPLETLLRPKHCVSYVELALKEQDQGSTSVEASKPAVLDFMQVEREKGREYTFILDRSNPSYGELTEHAKIAIATGIYPTIH